MRKGSNEGVSVPGVVRDKRFAIMLSVLISAVACASLALAGTGEAQGAQPADERAKNVIIFIGDGMGTSHRNLIRYATVGTAGWWPTRSNFLLQASRLAYCGTVATRIPVS